MTRPWKSCFLVQFTNWTFWCFPWHDVDYMISCYWDHRLLSSARTHIEKFSFVWVVCFGGSLFCLFSSKFTEEVRKPSVWMWIMCSDSLFHKNDVNTPQSNSLSSCTHWGGFTIWHLVFHVFFPVVNLKVLNKNNI